MKKKILICGVIIILIIAIGFATISGKDSSEEVGKGKKVALGSEVFITAIEPYTGAFVEDGTDEFVEEVLSITIENNGSEYIQLMSVTIDEKYVFDVTTLLPGEKMTVLEKSRAEYDKKIDLSKISVSNVALFNEKPSMHKNLLKISGKDNRITVKNISDKTFPGGRVFYKNKFNKKYIGGITYAGTIPELEKNEVVVLNSNHYLKDSSEFIFVTYAE